MGSELCRYTVTSSDESDEGEEDIVHISTVASRIVQTSMYPFRMTTIRNLTYLFTYSVVHQCGLFKFRTGRISHPSTPTASTRGRAAIFNLDAISRNLFNTKSGSSSRGISGADFFGNVSSSGSHRRSRSTNSRASTVITQTTGTSNDTSMRFSSRSISTTATSVMDEDSFGHKSRDSPRKQYNRGRSPGGASSPSKSRDSSRERHSVERELVSRSPTPDPDRSGWDLSMRLELARQNSLSQQHTGEPERLQRPKNPPESIMEGKKSFIHLCTIAQPYFPLVEDGASTIRRAPSIASTYRPRSTTPTQFADLPSRPSSAMSTRRPMGPRDVPKSPKIRPVNMEIDLENTLTQLGHPAPPPPPRTPSPPSHSPRKRLPLEPTDQIPLDMVHIPSCTPLKKVPSTKIEPLSIKKKNSVRRASPTLNKKNRDSPSTRTSSRTSREKESRMPTSNGHPVKPGLLDKAMTRAETTMEDVRSNFSLLYNIKFNFLIGLKFISSDQEDQA